MSFLSFSWGAKSLFGMWRIFGSVCISAVFDSTFKLWMDSVYYCRIDETDVLYIDLWIVKLLNCIHLMSCATAMMWVSCGVVWLGMIVIFYTTNRDADKSLARPISRCIFFNGENISFDASLVIYIYIYSTNIPPIMIINRIYEHQNLLSL